MATEIDPVCGMKVEPGRAADRVEHAGRTFYFCSRGCMLDFKDEPHRFFDPGYVPHM